MAKKPKFSMRPEMGEEGLLSNADVRITDAVITTWSDAGERALVGGREANDPCGKITFEPLEGDGEEQVQYLSAGKGNRLAPSEDGEEPAEEGPFLIPVEGSSAKGLNKQSRLYQFLASCSKPASGKLKFDSGILDEKGLTGLVGMELHVLRVPAPQQSSVAKEEGAREHTMLTCHEIYALPGKGKPSPTRKPKDEDDEDEAPKKGKKPVKEEKDEDEGEGSVEEETQTLIVKALSKAGEPMTKDEVVKAIFGAATKSANRKKILAMAQDDDFLGGEDAPWEYNAKKGTLTSIE